MAALLATLALGGTRSAPRRWITLWRFNFQVSEFVKLVIILLVARYLSELKSDEVNDPRLVETRRVGRDSHGCW